MCSPIRGLRMQSPVGAYREQSLNIPVFNGEYNL